MEQVHEKLSKFLKEHRCQSITPKIKISLTLKDKINLWPPSLQK